MYSIALHWMSKYHWRSRSEAGVCVLSLGGGLHGCSWPWGPNWPLSSQVCLPLELLSLGTDRRFWSREGDAWGSGWNCLLLGELPQPPESPLGFFLGLIV